MQFLLVEKTRFVTERSVTDGSTLSVLLLDDLDKIQIGSDLKIIFLQ